MAFVSLLSLIVLIVVGGVIIGALLAERIIEDRQRLRDREYSFPVTRRGMDWVTDTRPRGPNGTRVQ